MYILFLLFSLINCYCLLVSAIFVLGLLTEFLIVPFVNLGAKIFNLPISLTVQRTFEVHRQTSFGIFDKSSNLNTSTNPDESTGENPIESDSESESESSEELPDLIDISENTVTNTNDLELENSDENHSNHSVSELEESNKQTVTENKILIDENLD